MNDSSASTGIRDAADDGEPADRRHVRELVRDPVEGVGQRGQHGVRDHPAVGGDGIRVGPVDLERGGGGGIGIKQFPQVPVPVMGAEMGTLLHFDIRRFLLLEQIDGDDECRP